MNTSSLKSLGLVALLAIVATACFPVKRTTAEIVLESQGELSFDGGTYAYEFYRNDAYQCGKSGNFTFLLIEPVDDPGSEAPLWIYLHGGGTGYYQENGEYVGEEFANVEETLSRMFNKTLDKHLYLGDGEVKDTTLSRRMREGYRVLIPAMCDHDLHSGMGTPYPNNPNGLGPDGGEVNGLQANLAALDWVIANRDTGNVFVHGTSAGSVGAWSMSHALEQEGVTLNGAVMDSYLIVDRTLDLFEAGITTQQRKHPGFDPQQVVDKVGFYLRFVYVDEMIEEWDWREVPLFVLTGQLDPLCGGSRPLIPPAQGTGVTYNCEYWQGGVADAIAGQPNTPHVAYVAPGGNHSPSIDPDPQVHDRIDLWLEGILATNPPEPFPS